MNLLLVSPHRDDAAFSLSLSLHHWLQQGHEITLLNVFTRSLYAPYADIEFVREYARLDYVSAMRRREDEEFVTAVGGKICLADLELEDAPLRLQCDASEVCDMHVSATDQAIPCIRRGVDQWVKTQSRGQHCALILPLALGHHVDHCVVRDAGYPLTANIPSAFYEDLPYAMRTGVQEDLQCFCDEIKAVQNEILFPVLCHLEDTALVKLKRRLISIYQSQIDNEQVEAIANFAHRYDGAERMWVNRAWLEIACHEGLSSGEVSLERTLPG